MPRKVQRNAKKVGGQGEEVLQTISSQSDWKWMLSESGGLCCISLSLRVHVRMLNHVVWLGARPKISSSTIVTLMQSGTVATTGPAVNSQEPSIFLCLFLFLLRSPTLKHTQRNWFSKLNEISENQIKRTNYCRLDTDSLYFIEGLSESQWLGK